MFTNLHVHSSKGSLLDSILTTKQIAKYAVNNGQTAIGLSDHGTMYASMNMVNDCKKLGVKPITACEIYECNNHLEQNPDDKYNHLLLIAATTKGLKNLYQIVTEGYRNGFYKKPRVSVEWIKDNNYGEGIICLTACQAGRLSRCLEYNLQEEAKDFVNLLQHTFDYVSIEIQSHPTDSQIKANKLILDFAKENNLPWVITSDAHMERADQLDAHSIFVEISQDREVGEDYAGCHLQNEDDIFNYLGESMSKEDILCGIEETCKIANMVSDDIDYEMDKGTVMPQAHIPEGYDLDTYFREAIYEHFDDKFGHMTEEEQQIRRDRIEMEIPVLKELDFFNYLLIQKEFCEECDRRGIPRGYSRGSAANSLCVFMLNITQIDSVRWDLDFSRFANIGRKGTAADIDLDISKSRRQEAIQVLCDIFGADHVAPMATFNTLSSKVAIKDIGKVLNEKQDSPYFGKIPYSLRDEVAKMIPTVKTLSDLGEEEEKEVLLKELVGKNEKLDKVYKDFPLWFKYVMELEGLEKSRGKHASGILLTPKPVLHYTPLCLDNDRNLMSMYDMHICQDAKGGMGLVKEDCLGLETLDIVDMALKNANLTWKDVDINHLNFEDKKVYDEVYKKGYTINVFQMESFEARKMLIEAKADNVEDVILVNAANRPGTKDSFPDYCQNKLKPNSAEVIHPDLKMLFSQTKSVLMYQEQALALLRYAGFPEEEVENGRRAIGKKIPEEMKKLKPKFKKGLKEKGWNDSQINEIWDLLLKQSNYCFNRGHAVAYGLLSYLCAYMKVHYPTEFQAAALTAKSGDTPKIGVIINDCKRMGVKVLPPNINMSGRDFTAIPSKKEILFGLYAIKNIGESIVNEIINNRPYKSFNDYLNKIQDKSATIMLIKAGAFPTKNKTKLMKMYASSLFEKKEYEPVKTYKTKAEMLINWNINVDDYKVGKKVDKETVLKIYNQKKKEIFDKEEDSKYRKKIQEFKEKYATDEFLWEFQSLSMFLTDNPLEKAYELIGIQWDEIEDGNKAVVPCVIIDVTRKKDKHNNPFAYLSLCINNTIVEATIWSRQFKEYSHLIKKGSCLCVLGKKEEDHLFVEKIKPYQEWLDKWEKRLSKS